MTDQRGDDHPRIARVPEKSGKCPVSVIVPAKNEELNLPRCLAGLSWAERVFVVDSQSTDATVRIAESSGATVVQFHYSGTYPRKQNWSLENLPFGTDWVLIVAADEVVPADLADEVRRAVATDLYDGYDVRRRNFFMGREIKHCGYGSIRTLRLFRHRLGRYEAMPTEAGSATGDVEVHEHILLKGRLGHLRNSILHYPYPSISAWVEKHNRYSTWEAELYESFREGQFLREERRLSWPLFFKRRLKQVYLRLPLRFLIRFVYAYVLRLGFLDGKAGFVLCSLLTFYDFLAWAKVWERRVSQQAIEPVLPQERVAK